MTLRQYLTIMLLGTILCWVSWTFVIINIDPFQNNQVGFLFFYLSLFFALLGSLSLLSFLFFRIFSRKLTPIFRHVRTSFRTACLLSLIVIILLYLQGKELLNIWNLGAFVLACLFVFSFVVSTKKRPVSSYSNNVETDISNNQEVQL